jgi:hypothetical protein
MYVHPSACVVCHRPDAPLVTIGYRDRTESVRLCTNDAMARVREAKYSEGAHIINVTYLTLV